MPALALKNHYTIIGEGYNLDDAHNHSFIAFPDSFRSGHVFVSGSTRSGKTGLCENIIEQDIRKGYNVILIDPKIDQPLANKIVQVATSVGRKDDLMFINPIFPEDSISLNPLSHWFVQEEIVSHCIAGIKEGKEPFFRDVSENISSIAIEGMDLKAKLKDNKLKAEYDFDIIAETVSRQGLQELYSELLPFDSPDNPEVKSVLRKIKQTLSYGEDYFGKVASSLQVAMNRLTTGKVGKIIGKGADNPFLTRLEEGKGVILVCQLGSLIIHDAALTLAKVILSMLMNYVGRVMASQKERLDVPLCLHIDEAQSVMFQQFDEAYAKVGSSRTYITSYVQDSAQVRAEMGADRARAILSNNNTRIFLRSPDQESAEPIADYFGTHRVQSPIVAYNSITSREVEEPILMPFDIVSLKPREFFMLTYAGEESLKGRYRGKTCDKSDAWLKVIYPSVPSY